jgi:hypothetical protein
MQKLIGDQMGSIAVAQIMDADGGTVPGDHATLTLDKIHHYQTSRFASL